MYSKRVQGLGFRNTYVLVPFVPSCLICACKTGQCAWETRLVSLLARGTKSGLADGHWAKKRETIGMRVI